MNSLKFLYPFLPALLAISLVMVSGCTMPGTPFDSNTPAGAGIVIESFGTEPKMTEVYSGEEVKFVLKFRNTGTQKAENCFAELLGLDQMWKGAAGTRTNPNNQEVFPDESSCQYDNRGGWITLLPPDPATGIEGGDKICTWRYVSPVVYVPHVDYKPRARVFYDYKSFLIKTITIVPKEELVVLQNQGKSLPVETSSKSNAPISLDMETRSPIRTHGTGNILTFPIVINIENIGGGTVCANSERCRKFTEGGSLWNQFKLTIELPDSMSFEPGSCGNGGNVAEEDIYLVAGKSQTIVCKVMVNSIPERLVQKNIRVTAEYGYFIDKTIELSVLPSG